MAISSAWFLSVLVAVWFAADISQADRLNHGINLLAHPSSGRTAQEQAIEDRSDNQYNYDRISAGNPSDSDLYLLNSWNAKTRPLNEPVFQNLSPVDSTWSKMLSDEPDRSMSLQKAKREGHSLSIVNPLDVLRQRMILEMARRRMKVNQDQIKANDVILKTLGKRQSTRDDSDCDEEELAKRRVAKQERRRSQRQDYLDSAQEAAADDFVV